MSNKYIRNSVDKTVVRHNELVKDFLEDNPTVRCGKQYYFYDFDKGIFKETEIDDIQLEAARYFEQVSNKSWTVKSKSEVTEALRVNIPDVEEMEPDKSMICLGNCVLDLLSGETYEHSPDFLFIHCSSVEYDESAKCPMFKKFLKQITLDNKARMYTLIEFMGLCLSKDIGFGTAVILKGSGCNGKSVFCNVLCALLDEGNYTAINLKDLPAFGTGKILGKRLVIMTEITKSTSNNVMSNELKQIASGEIMSCNQKYKPIIDIRPFAKILILTNHSIGFLDDDSDGALRRTFVVPFECYISPEERDYQLEDKLLTELSGILNIAVKGYRRLVKNGYQYSSKEESDAIVEEVLKASNPFRAFVKERIIYSVGNKLKYDDIRREFVQWGNEYGLISNDSAGVSVDGTEIFNEISNYYNVERYKSNGTRGIRNVSFKEV